jgi:hypothetical protein
MPPICSHYCNRKLCRHASISAWDIFNHCFILHPIWNISCLLIQFFLTLTIKLVTCEYHRYINSYIHWQYKVYVTWGFMKVILQYIVVIALCRRVDLYVGLSRKIIETRFRQVQAANGVIPYVLLWWLLFSYAGDEIECLKGVPCP